MQYPNEIWTRAFTFAASADNAEKLRSDIAAQGGTAIALCAHRTSGGNCGRGVSE
jgi:hypothetical protein